MRWSLILIAAMTVSAPVVAHARECPAAGMKMHWIADYCMSKLHTDDEIAAGSCINAESARAFRSDCVAKVHYKRALCRKQRPNDIKRCVADKTFVGPTVRNGGVGGR